MKKLLAFSSLAAFGALVFACAGGVGSVESEITSGSSSGTNPKPEQELVAPPALKITATFVAATLGDDCGASGAPAEGRFADCAPEPGGGGCGGFCQQSNMQINFASSGDDDATIEIVSVSLRDASGAEVGTMTSREPQMWKSTAYVAWDQIVPAKTSVKASYKLSAPPWSTTGITDAKSYSAKYRLRVNMKVNGRPLTIESTDLTREPQVVT